MEDRANRLRNILEDSNVPETLIEEIEAKSLTYQIEFINAIRIIMQNEVISLIAFMDTREKLKQKAKQKARL